MFLITLPGDFLCSVQWHVGTFEIVQNFWQVTEQLKQMYNFVYMLPDLYGGSDYFVVSYKTLLLSTIYLCYSFPFRSCYWASYIIFVCLFVCAMGYDPFVPSMERDKNVFWPNLEQDKKFFGTGQEVFRCNMEWDMFFWLPKFPFPGPVV